MDSQISDIESDLGRGMHIIAVRSFLGAHGLKKGALSKFIEEAVRWHVFRQTVGDARKAFAGVPEGELQKTIDDAVEAVRAKRYRDRAGRS